MDENETMYIVDRSNHRVMKWKKGALSGQVVAGIAGIGSNSSQLHYPVDVVVDTDGTIYVADTYNHRIQKYLRDAYRGETILSINNPSGVALDDEGTLYVSSFNGGSLFKRNKGENNWQSVGNNVTSLQYITVDRNLSVVGVNEANKRVIIKYKDNQTLHYIADGAKEVFFNPMFEPYSAILDQSGVIYIVEQSNHRVTRWVPNAPTGTIIIGGGAAGSSPNRLNNPSDLTFDHEGNLYIVDTNNNRVQKFAIDKSSCQ
jgi:secreted PhoX family phosphatase